MHTLHQGFLKAPSYKLCHVFTPLLNFADLPSLFVTSLMFVLHVFCSNIVLHLVGKSKKNEHGFSLLFVNNTILWNLATKQSILQVPIGVQCLHSFLSSCVAFTVLNNFDNVSINPTFRTLKRKITEMNNDRRVSFQLLPQNYTTA